MTITPELKDWLMGNAYASDKSTDAELQEAVAKAVVDGNLTVEELAGLAGDKPKSKRVAEQLLTTLSAMQAGMADMAAKMDTIGQAATSAPAAAAAAAAAAKAATEPLFTRRVDPFDKLAVDVQAATPQQLFAAAGNDGASLPNVKNVAKQFETKRETVMYSADHKHAHLRNQPVMYSPDQHRRIMLSPSQLDKGVIGAWFKLMAAKAIGRDQAPRWTKLTELDEQLIKYALYEMPFRGILHGKEDQPLTGEMPLTALQRKDLLDETGGGGSEGLEAVPIVFDDAVIMTALLSGELFPLVNTVDLARGRRVEGFSMGNWTGTWTAAEGAAITPFDTAAFIAAFDTTIFPLSGAFEMGRDFSEDSPVDIGSFIIASAGQTFQRELDNVIADGDGTTQPQGVMQTTGATVVVTTNGTLGDPTLDDYEGLLFGIGKEIRAQSDRGRQVYVTTDTTYRRSRSLPTGPADARRLFGMSHENYMTFEHPHKITAAAGFANSDAAFFNASRYRMYRRLGLRLEVEEAGNYLRLRNLRLLTLRARFGGQMETGAAVARSTTFMA